MKNSFITGIYTDLYQLSMAQVYFRQGTGHQQASFDYFLRQLPFNGGYTVFAGLADLLSTLEELRFTPDDIDYLKKIGVHKEFADSLAQFRFQGTIHAVKEGEIIFPNEPVLRVEANIIE